MASTSSGIPAWKLAQPVPEGPNAAGRKEKAMPIVLQYRRSVVEWASPEEAQRK